MIPLPPKILRMCRRLAQKPHLPSDHVFLNKHGKPYTKDCVVRKMDRLRDQAGISTKGGERLVIYCIRHAFGTDNAGKVSDIELAEVMGHTETRMTRRYVHSSADRLRGIQRRLQARPGVPENALISGNGRSVDAAVGVPIADRPPASLPTPVPPEALTQAVS